MSLLSYGGDLQLFLTAKAHLTKLIDLIFIFTFLAKQKCHFASVLTSAFIHSLDTFIEQLTDLTKKHTHILVTLYNKGT